MVWEVEINFSLGGFLLFSFDLLAEGFSLGEVFLGVDNCAVKDWGKCSSLISTVK